MKALCFECCQAVNPKLRPRESVSEITLQVLPPLKPFAAARYASELNGESLPQLPFTGSFAVSRKPGAGQVVSAQCPAEAFPLHPRNGI